MGRQCLGWIVMFADLILLLFVGFSGGGLGFGSFFAVITFNQSLLLMSLSAM